MLYFVIALLDKWIALINGGQLAGLTSGKVDLIKPVGFGLAYYLIGAVLLDFNAHKLHQLEAKNEEEILSSDESIAHAVKAKAQKRRLLYWRTLWRYLMFHVWGLALTSTLLWLFTSEVTKKDGTLVFVSYVAAYTGLLVSMIELLALVVPVLLRLVLPLVWTPSTSGMGLFTSYSFAPETRENRKTLTSRPSSGINSRRYSRAHVP